MIATIEALLVETLAHLFKIKALAGLIKAVLPGELLPWAASITHRWTVSLFFRYLFVQCRLAIHILNNDCVVLYNKMHALFHVLFLYVLVDELAQDWTQFITSVGLIPMIGLLNEVHLLQTRQVLFYFLTTPDRVELITREARWHTTNEVE